MTDQAHAAGGAIRARASFQREQDRILAMYAARDRDPRTSARYSWWNPAQVLMIQQRERILLRLLARCGCTSLAGKRILEVGCGDGYWLRQLIQWGATPARVYGVDLVPDRVARATALTAPGATIRCASAHDAAFASESFDLIVQSTMFTSILAPEMRARTAGEMARMLKPGGHLVWYDFRVNSPGTRDVHGIGRRELRRLFPGFAMTLKRTTLAPPLARALAPYSPLLCEILSRAPWLCTHYLGVLHKA